MSKVLVGLSGGVDSAVAAYLLKKAGHEVIGVMLRTWSSTEGQEDDSDIVVEQNKCCEIDDARAVAFKLGIDFYPINCVKDFYEKVIEPFVSEYTLGRTPNPCIECNRYVKFERLLYFADIMKADYIATGHYARIVQLPNGRYTVKKSGADKKDQTYMLYKLNQEQLKRVMFPLGELDKEKVREIAKEAGIPVAEKKDSQEICFIPDDDHAAFIMRHINNKSDFGLDSAGSDNSDCRNTDANSFCKPGDFVDKEGKVLGQHKGIINYTIGQRKGLGIAMGHPVYVTGLDPTSNKVIVGEEVDLFSSECFVKDYNLLSIEDLKPGEKVTARVKIRYHHQGEEAMLEKADDGMLKLTFAKPVKSITPGQSAVFYDNDNCVLGGGIIA